MTKAHLVQSFLGVAFDVIYPISKTCSYSFTYPQAVLVWIEGPEPLRANAQRGQSWPQLFANQWPTDFALIAHISAFAPQTNIICISIMAISLIILAAPANVTYVTGHLTIALRNSPCHPIKLSNGMSVHHIRYCYHHTSIWFYRRGERSFRGHRRNPFHEQLKLPGAARGLPGDRCPSRRSFFAYLYNCPFARQASGHEPGRASRNRSHQNQRSETVKTRRYKKIFSPKKPPSIP